MKRANASLRDTRIGLDGEVCSITYGHNVGVRKCTVIFSSLVKQIILTPEEAEDMANHLRFYAACARGEKPS